MNKYKNPLVLIALLLHVICGPVCASDFMRKTQDDQEFAFMARDYLNRSPNQSVKAVYSDCHRNRVIWSGGIARRGPDRISPRPTRSRWQSPIESRIYCSGGNSFTQIKVADEPWIR